MEIEYIDYTINEFMQLDTEQQNELLTFAKYHTAFDTPKDHLTINTLTDKPFGLIKDIQNDLSNGLDMYSVIEYLQKIKPFKLSDITLLRLYQQKSWLTEQIDNLTTVENESLCSNSSVKEITAGIDDFEELGVFMQIYNLCKGDVTKYNEVYNIPYHIAFSFLLADKKSIDYQRKLYSNNN